MKYFLMGVTKCNISVILYILLNFCFDNYVDLLLFLCVGEGASPLLVYKCIGVEYYSFLKIEKYNWTCAISAILITALYLLCSISLQPTLIVLLRLRMY